MLLVIMNLDIGLSSLTINKLKNSHDGFVKYDIDVALDEVENNDSGIKLKYKFVLLSNPTNTKISLEGIASILGNESEVSKSLEPDQRNIPLVVNMVYQEIFPMLYVISKSMQIPCPAYKLSQLSATQPEIIQEEPVSQELEVSASNPRDIVPEIKMENAEPPSEPQNQEVLQEANVSSI